MSGKKEDSGMGLPKVSGKKRWSVEEEEEDPELGQPSKKAVCTSPPYALCAEDVLSSPPCPQPARTPPSSSVMSKEGGSVAVFGDVTDLGELPASSSRRDDDGGSTDGEDMDEEGFVDDEEDKDSGFIDGNSIDNSDEDDDSSLENKSDTSLQSSSSCPSFSPQATCFSTPEKPFYQNDSGFETSPVNHPSSDSPAIVPLPPMSTHSKSSVNSFCIPNEENCSYSTVSTSTVQTTSTNVMCTYASVGVSLSYSSNPQSYQSPVNTSISSLVPSTYSSEMYENRHCAPSWSCTFYDGSQPTTTNKYMEISPSRIGHTTQSIQCDENGKSYLELGGATPYPRTYSNECNNNFTTTTQPSYTTNSTYCQSFTGSSTPPPSPYGSTANGYFGGNGRSPINAGSPSQFAYHRNDSYSSSSSSSYDGESCSYNNYPNSGFVSHHSSRGLGFSPHRTPLQRCTSSLCDLTRSSPRPACYNQRRLSVLNMSMFKLNRFSRFPEPSLHRSVLICNTLRHIEREMESEGLNMAAILSHSHSSYGGHAVNNSMSQYGPSCLDPMPSMPASSPSSEGPLPSFHSPLISHPPVQSPLPPPMTPPPSTFSFTTDHPQPYPSYPPSSSKDSPTSIDGVAAVKDTYLLRPLLPQSSVGERRGMICVSESPVDDHQIEETTLTPLESPNAQSSSRASGSEDRIGGINWCSVLSLSSQTDLDTMNNNECNDWTTTTERDHHHHSSSVVTLAPPPTSLAPIQDCPSDSANPVNVSQGVRPSSEASDWRLPSLSADDVLKSFPEPHRKHDDDLDCIINVLVGS